MEANARYHHDNDLLPGIYYCVNVLSKPWWLHFPTNSDNWVCCALGEQQGQWSLFRLLCTYHFGSLVECDAVRAVGPNPSRDADSGDLVVALARPSAQAGLPMSAEDLLHIPQGQSVLGGLRVRKCDVFFNIERHMCSEHSLLAVV